MLPEYFIESWIFSSALSVIDQCDTWVPPTELDGIQLARFSASKGELLEFAKTQVRNHHGDPRHILIFFAARPAWRESRSSAHRTAVFEYNCGRKTCPTFRAA